MYVVWPTNLAVGASCARDLSTHQLWRDKALEFPDVYYNRGLAYGEKEEFGSAITDYTKAIQLNADYANAYNNRGVAYFIIGATDLAITDFSEVIQLQPDNAMAYYTRTKAWFSLRAWEQAKADLTIASTLGLDIIALFSEEYGSVLEFNWRMGIKLPPDITAMLTPLQV